MEKGEFTDTELFHVKRFNFEDLVLEPRYVFLETLLLSSQPASDPALRMEAALSSCSSKPEQLSRSNHQLRVWPLGPELLCVQKLRNRKSSVHLVSKAAKIHQGLEGKKA